MSFFDKFMSAIKLNDDDDLEDDEYFDEADSDLDDTRPQRRLIREREEEDVSIPPQTPSFTSRRSSAASQPARRAQKQPSKVSSFRPRRAEAQEEQTDNFSVCVIRPKSMEDALQIAQTLIAHCTIILNLEGLDLDVSQRIFDFASGACCAARGQLDKISNYIFVLTPHDVEISGEFQEILTGAFDQNLDPDSDDL